MGSISSSEIISILKEEIENYDLDTGDQEVGQVIWVGDGIATIYGMDQAMYGEIVLFENGIKGMVQDVRKNEIGCILSVSYTHLDVYKRQMEASPPPHIHTLPPQSHNNKMYILFH